MLCELSVLLPVNSHSQVTCPTPGCVAQKEEVLAGLLPPGWWTLHSPPLGAGLGQNKADRLLEVVDSVL